MSDARLMPAQISASLELILARTAAKLNKMDLAALTSTH